MKTAYRLTADNKIQLHYRSLPLINLVELIVDHRDQQALNEFHSNRTLFTYNNSKPILFINFLDNLHKNFANRKWRGRNDLEIADIAYDLTLAKFTYLPNSTVFNTGNEKNNKLIMKQPMTDCRYYFKAFLEYVTNLSECNGSNSQLKEEYYTARAMQSLVWRHFNLSILEAKRKSNPFWSRYYWNIKGVKVCVWLPKALKGKERHKWLEKKIDNPDPTRSNERERIQAIIDQQLIREQFIPISKVENRIEKETSPFWSDSDEELGISIAKTVADEKAMNIKTLRRSIQALGKKKLKNLILCVFDNLSTGDFKDGILAKKFDLSKATFSRFSGSRWFETDSNVPDLWLNTAQVLSKHNIFKEVVIKSGYWKHIQTTLEKKRIDP